MFKGLCTALITPFHEDGSIDFASFDRLIGYQLDNGVDSLLFLGTTGEPSTMCADEKRAVIDYAVKKVGGRVPVVIGCGTNNTSSAVEQAKEAEALGADALLAVTPYYNKCTQKGVVEYYRTLSENVHVPIVAYNIPGRTGVNILPETVLEISKIKGLAAIKEACGNLNQIMETARLIRGRMHLLSGDDSLGYPILALGGDGLTSVLSNACPAPVAEMVHAALDGRYADARELHYQLAPLASALFMEVSPVPVKYLCKTLGITGDTVRAPLLPAEEKTRSVLDALVKELNLA